MVLFNYALFDLKFSKKHFNRILSNTNVEQSENRERNKRRKKNKYRNSKRKQKKQFNNKHYKLKGSKAKDARYSNHRKIRRMFRNH